MFPFQYPVATQFYLGLYLITLVIHLALMFYVFAGTCHLAIFGGAETSSAKGRVNEMVRDWLPFALSAAITAGIAPLLFIQLLYQFDYYTANILLSHRWMSFLPVLIVAFYGLYLLKMKIFVKRRPFLDRGIAWFVFLCICYVGYTFSENHLLSIQSKATWTAQYSSGKLAYWTWETVPRVGLILGQAFSITSVVLYWQIKMHQQQVRVDLPAGLSQHLAIFASSGLIVSIVCFCIYLFGAISGSFRGGYVEGEAALLREPYIYLFSLGLFAQLWFWSTVWLKNDLLAKTGLLIAAVSLLTLLFGALVREHYRTLRIVTNDMLALHKHHLEADGMWMFFGFAIVNGLLITWLIQKTRGSLNGPMPTAKN